MLRTVNLAKFTPIMKCFTCLLLTVLFLASCGSTPGRSGVYFDQNGKAVAKEKQRKIFNRNRGKLITATITNGDLLEYHLVPRKEAGQISPEDNQLIEQTFFKHHYPCSSFTVVDQDGNYRSYFGAFVKEEVAKTARAVKRGQ